jgi:hypothetical protein
MDAKWKLALVELGKVRAAFKSHPDDKAKAQIENRLQIAAKTLRDKYGKTPEAINVRDWVKEYSDFPFPIRSFDLAWLECKAFADEKEYGDFIAALGRLEQYPQIGDAEEIESVRQLLSQIGASATDVVYIRKLVEALPEGTQDQPIKKLLADLLVEKVATLVAHEYEGLHAHQFAALLRLVAKSGNASGVPARVRACHAECLLRQEKKLPKADAASTKQAKEILDKVTGEASDDFYVRFVFGLLQQCQTEWLLAAKDYQTAFHEFEAKRQKWQNDERCQFASTALYEAGTRMWAGADEDKGQHTLTYFQLASNLDPNTPTPTNSLIAWAQADLHANKHDAFGDHFKELTGRQEFRTSEHLATLGKCFVSWAASPGRERQAEQLLDGAGPAVDAAWQANDKDPDLAYWSGRIHWNAWKKSKKASDRKDALQRLAAALALSPSAKRVSVTDKPYARIKGLVSQGGQGTANADLRELLALAVSKKEQPKSRHWDLLYHLANLRVDAVMGMCDKNAVAPEKKYLLRADASKEEAKRLILDQLSDAAELIANNKNRVELVGEGHIFATSAIYVGVMNEIFAKETYRKEERSHWLALGDLLENVKTFEEWPHGRRNAMKVADAVESYAALESGEEKTRLLEQAKKIRENYKSPQPDNSSDPGGARQLRSRENSRSAHVSGSESGSLL